MAKNKVTRSRAATNASATLRNEETGRDSKTAAGSTLAQTHEPKKATSDSAAKAASKVLRDGRTSKASKSAAASALAQKKSKK